MVSISRGHLRHVIYYCVVSCLYHVMAEYIKANLKDFSIQGIWLVNKSSKVKVSFIDENLGGIFSRSNK